VFNDIARWNKIIVKWGSICCQQQQFLNLSSDEVRRTEDQTYLSCHLLAILDPCLISHQHKSKKNEDFKISVIYLSSLSESRFYLIISFQNNLSSLAYTSISRRPKIMDKFWTIVDFNIFLWL
jgi:hypothetical protein